MRKTFVAMLLLSAFAMPVYAGLFDDIDKEVLGQEKHYQYWWEKAIDDCNGDYACQERILRKVDKDLEMAERTYQHFQLMDGMREINRNLQDFSEQQQMMYNQQRMQQEMIYNQQQIMYNQMRLQNFMNY